MTLLLFLDTETTGLDPTRHVVWEVGWYLASLADDSTELVVVDKFQAFVKLTDWEMACADPIALDIGRFYERHPDYARSDGRTLAEMAAMIGLSPAQSSQSIRRRLLAALAHLGAETPRDVSLVGACPWFDDGMLAQWWPPNRSVNDRPWHYHLIDIETLIAGFTAGRIMSRPPFKYAELLAAIGVTDPEDGKHTALGDALVVMRAFAVLHSLSIVGVDQ